MRIKINIPDNIVDFVAIGAIQLSLQHLEILRNLPLEVSAVENVPDYNKDSALEAIRTLDHYGLLNWHKRDQILHNTRRTKYFLGMLEGVKSNIRPDSMRILYRLA